MEEFSRDGREDYCNATSSARSIATRRDAASYLIRSARLGCCLLVQKAAAAQSAEKSRRAHACMQMQVGWMADIYIPCHTEIRLLLQVSEAMDDPA
jgi:hypothetical protein